MDKQRRIIEEEVKHIGLLNDHQIKEVQNLQVRMIPVNTAVTSRFGVPGLKAAMDVLGMYGGPVRSPLMALSKENKKIVEAILTKARIKK